MKSKFNLKHLFLTSIFLLTVAGIAFSQGTTESVSAPIDPVKDVQATETPDEAVELYEEDIPLEEPQAISEGVAYIEGTTEGSEISGVISMLETTEGLYVEGEFINVPPGEHGIHIHENGSCEDTGNAAGGHFNPHGVDHGFLPEDGHESAHVGDMGNIEIDENGEGFISVLLPGVSLTQGETNVTGKAIILHEKADDFEQPTGNAGGRIGCGLIEVISE